MPRMSYHPTFDPDQFPGKTRQMGSARCPPCPPSLPGSLPPLPGPSLPERRKRPAAFALLLHTSRISARSCSRRSASPGTGVVRGRAGTQLEHASTLRYARDLREIRQVDAELGAAALARRLGLAEDWHGADATWRGWVEPRRPRPRSRLPHRQRDDGRAPPARSLHRPADRQAHRDQRPARVLSTRRRRTARLAEADRLRQLLALQTAREASAWWRKLHRRLLRRLQNPHAPPPRAAGARRACARRLPAAHRAATGRGLAHCQPGACRPAGTRRCARPCRAELRLYATVFTNASEGMLITDAHSRIIAANPAFSCITGYSPAEVAGARRRCSTWRRDAGFYRRMVHARQPR